MLSEGFLISAVNALAHTTPSGEAENNDLYVLYYKTILELRSDFLCFTP